MSLDQIFQFALLLTAVAGLFIKSAKENNRPKPNGCGYFLFIIILLG